MYFKGLTFIFSEDPPENHLKVIGGLLLKYYVLLLLLLLLFLDCHATLHPKEVAADIRTAFLSRYWPIIGRVPFLGTLSRQTRIVQSETVFYHGPCVSSGESKTGAHI